MPLQLVRTTEAGVRLVSLSTDHFCHRLAVESELSSDSNAERIRALLEKDSSAYSPGDAQKFFSSGKFPCSTDLEKKLTVDRYLLLKVGQFPDCYERLAENFRSKGNDVSALVTCERSVSAFYSWGHPMHFHSKMLRHLGRRDEVVESARSSMGMPKWTLADTKAVSLPSFVRYQTPQQAH